MCPAPSSAARKTAQDAEATSSPKATAERFLRALHEPGAWFEVRALDCPERKGSTWRGQASGYHDDPAAAAADALTLDVLEAAGVYVTVNPVNPACNARAFRRIVFKPKSTTGDAEVIGRRWLPVDLDPDRPAGIAATDTERAGALALAERVREELAAAGWPAPMRCSTPNGAHLLYRVELPNDPDAADLLRRVLEGLSARFNGSGMKVDRTLFNASRILRIPGTTGRKGDITPERPHRRGELLDVPAELVPVSRELLKAAAAPKAPAIPPRAQAPRTTQQALAASGRPEFARFDPTPDGVRSYLEQHGVTVKRIRAKGGDSILDLSECPITGAAGGTSVSVIVGGDGKISFPNRHDRGIDLTWTDLRDHLEPGYREHVARMKDRAAGAAPSPARIAAAPAPSEEPAADGEPKPHPWAGLRATLEEMTASRPEPPRWLVDGVLEEGAVALVYGKAGSLKSMLAADLAVCFAAGLEWLAPEDRDPRVSPRKTAGGRVVWIDLDNGRKRSHARFYGLAAGHGGRAGDLSYYAFPPLDLTKPESVELLFQLIAAERASLVVIDTLINSMTVKSENDNAELRGPLFALRQIAEKTGCAIIAIHHPNKATAAGANHDDIRGGSAIAGAVDVSFRVQRPDIRGDVVTVAASKERGAPVPPFTARWAFEAAEDGVLERGLFFGVVPDRENAGALAELEAEVKAALEPGPMNQKTLHKKVGGRKGDMIAAAAGLVKRGEVTTAKGKYGATVYALA